MLARNMWDVVADLMLDGESCLPSELFTRVDINLERKNDGKLEKEPKPLILVSSVAVPEF